MRANHKVTPGLFQREVLLGQDVLRRGIIRVPDHPVHLHGNRVLVRASHLDLAAIDVDVEISLASHAERFGKILFAARLDHAMNAPAVVGRVR